MGSVDPGDDAPKSLGKVTVPLWRVTASGFECCGVEACGDKAADRWCHPVLSLQHGTDVGTVGRLEGPLEVALRHDGLVADLQGSGGMREELWGVHPVNPRNRRVSSEILGPRGGPQGSNTRPQDLSFKRLRGRKRQEPAQCVGWGWSAEGRCGQGFWGVQFKGEGCGSPKTLE